MTVPLSQLISDWLPTAGWTILEVKGGSIVPVPEAKHTYIGGSTYTKIKDDSVGGINVADPDFFIKLDEYLTHKYLGGSAWYQAKMNPRKPRQQIWP
jgi:hypothetical protein